ncbi:MAG TPA: hypothetical protein VK904_03810, partial [Miltoncostaeaceae bacterium]|nr:hypothetical protein [Miltoncostaeaceae bacterium]
MLLVHRTAVIRGGGPSAGRRPRVGREGAAVLGEHDVPHRAGGGAVRGREEIVATMVGPTTLGRGRRQLR